MFWRFVAMLHSQHAEHKLMVEPYPQSVRHDALDAEVIVVGVELLAPEHGTLCHWRLRPTLLAPEHGTLCHWRLRPTLR
jgi:hypothetical protein